MRYTVRYTYLLNFCVATECSSLPSQASIVGLLLTTLGMGGRRTPRSWGVISPTFLHRGGQGYINSWQLINNNTRLSSLCQMLLQLVQQFEITFLVFKMAASAILDFRSYTNFISWGGTEGRDAYHSKFEKNWSIHCRVTAIFQFLKMATAAILNF